VDGGARMAVSMNIRHHLGASYEEVRDAVLLVERLGYAGAYFPDHYLATQLARDPAQGGRVAARRDMTPSDCWTLIAMLVPQTQTVRLGTLMSSATFRHPSTLAVVVAQLNRVSGGRIDLGLGTNWMQAEHEAFGFAFPSQRERFELLWDQLALIRSLWQDDTASRTVADGARASRYELVDPPVIAGDGDGGQARIIVGGVGLVKTPRTAATFADEVNSTTAGGLDRVPAFVAACDRACEAIGRDPATLRRSVMLWVCCGRDDPEIAARAEAAGMPVDRLPSAGVVPCTPQQLVDQLGELRRLGVAEVILASRGPFDPDEMELIGTQVVPVAPE
jgi:alkanesulfonate monooxygenase SsuD/methylene tetrahydromethanopterin reductase-like flavin-dependent oxidoreductase (luciferase family)